MNRNHPPPHTRSSTAGVVPSEDFAEDAQETAVWADDSASRPVDSVYDGGEDDAEEAAQGLESEQTRTVLHVSDDFEEELPTLARHLPSSEIPLSGDFDPELADMARSVTGEAGPAPAGLTFSDDYEEDLPTMARMEEAPPPAPEARSEHTQMLGEDEFDALSVEPPEDLSDPTRDTAGLVGQTFGGFRVVRKIAEGGMASVYLGRKSGPRGFAQHAALKVVHPHFAHQQAFVDMFLDEARIAALINHPSVCRVLDFGQARGTYFLAMEYVHGESWADVITAMLAYPAAREHVWPVAAYVVAQSCEGLHAAHQSTDESGRHLEVVHRDVSPQNIFVAYDGTVRVLDFGIASAADRLTSTRTGTVKGRLAYMAPEQMRAEVVDRRADIWSLGVMLREALEGRRLFRRRTEAESMMAVVNEPLPEWQPDVPHELRAIADRALSRDRDARFDNCRDMGRALTQYLATQASALSSAEVSGWVTLLFPERMAEKRGWLQQPAPGSLPPPGEGASGRPSRSGTPTDITSDPGLLGQLEPESGSELAAPMGRYVPTLKLEAVRLPKRRKSLWPWVALVVSMLALVAVASLLMLPAERSGPVLEALGLRPPSQLAGGLKGAPQVAAPPAQGAGESAPGVLVVEYQGGWADVYVDGTQIGKTPLRRELPAGRAIIELRPYGNTPGIKHPMKFAPGQTQKLRIQAPDTAEGESQAPDEAPSQASDEGSLQ